MTAAKRCADVLCSAAGLVLLSPLFAAAALLIRREDGGSVFFRQERVGRGGRLFRIWKFRTMTPGADAGGPQLTVGADARVTRVGARLRAWKLDELPQLLNVLAGEMTLVGPRPEVPRYVRLYTPAEQRVLDLVPGVTDPASLAFRHESDLLADEADPERAYLERILPEKLAMSWAYGQRATLWTDLGVILETVAVLTGFGDPLGRALEKEKRAAPLPRSSAERAA